MRFDTVSLTLVIRPGRLHGSCLRHVFLTWRFATPSRPRTFGTTTGRQTRKDSAWAAQCAVFRSNGSIATKGRARRKSGIPAQTAVCELGDLRNLGTHRAWQVAAHDLRAAAASDCVATC
jgi:hypothetical protein